jgi:hypothetical protein
MIKGIRIKAGYKTYSGNTMVLEINGHWLPRENVPLVHQEDYKQLCEGCKGLNGGCSEWAPYFEWIKPSMKMFFVVDVKIDMAWAIKYAHRHKNSVIHHNYFRCGYADLLTDRYTWGIIKNMEQASGAFAIGLGHCHGCTSKKKCTVLRGEPCINMPARHYSMEATGVECSALNEYLYGTRLPWWFKGAELPYEMRRYAGLFSNDNLDYMLLDMVKAHRSFIPLDQVVPMPWYEAEIVSAPSTSMDAGQVFPMYVGFEDGLVGQESVA